MARTAEPGDGEGAGRGLRRFTAQRAHVSCDFTLVFLGFDEDDGRDFWIHVHPPTAEDGPGETLAYQGSVELTGAQGEQLSGEYPRDAAGEDGSREVLRFGDLDGLTAENRHDQQGWHLKLTVDGPKHEVFWIDCDDVAAPAEVTEEQQQDEQQRPQRDDEAAMDVGGWSPTPDRVAAEPEVTRVLAAGETRLGIGGWQDEAVAAEVTGEQLPRTGVDLLVLLSLALGMTVVGTLVLRRGRGTFEG